jgi:hypothetical protein
VARGHQLAIIAHARIGGHLSDTERWQVTTLVAHADKLSLAVAAELSR